MPHFSRARVSETSRRPWATNARASLRKFRGRTKSESSASSRSSSSWNADRRKNQLSSRSRSSGILWIGQVWSSPASWSDLKSAQRGQYQPSYVPLYTCPLSWTRWRISCTRCSWRGSDVRMKKSFVTFRRGSSALKRSTLRSPSSFGVIPSRSAASATGSPCSSVPVRKNTSSPRWRMCRASTSAAIVV